MLNFLAPQLVKNVRTFCKMHNISAKGTERCVRAAYEVLKVKPSYKNHEQIVYSVTGFITGGNIWKQAESIRKERQCNNAKWAELTFGSDEE